MVIDFILLLGLFALLGKSADVVVHGVKKLTKDYKIPLIFSGLVLGFFTSSPEFFIGITTTAQGVNQISFGNLIGGVIVLLGFITPLNIILNRTVKTRGEFNFFGLFFTISYLALPLIMALDGVITLYEGITLVIIYVILSFVIVEKDLKNISVSRISFYDHRKIFLLIVSGLALILIISNFIVKLSLTIVSSLNLPLFWVGLIVFSLGTNLPELMITVRSWKNKSRDLAVGNILGSAVTNIFIAGIISMARPVVIEVNIALYFLLFFFVILCILFMFFALTKKCLTRKEGISLFMVYLIFLASQFFFSM